MSETAFEYYEFTDDDLKSVQHLIGTHSNSSYWKNVLAFLDDLQYKTYQQLSLKQRNWASSIKADLKSI